MLDWLTKFLNPAEADAPRDPHAFALAPVFGGQLPARHPAMAVWRRFRVCATISDNCQLGLMAWCAGTPRQVRIGSRTICRGLLHCDNEDGSIEIGELVYLGDNVIVSTRAGIRIGARTLIAHGAQIFDHDAHPVDARERHADYLNLLGKGPRSKAIGAAPVVIGEDCWLGMNSLVLKGVTIGARSVVAAGSVVIDDVAADSVVAGNPARLIRSLLGEEVKVQP